MATIELMPKGIKITIDNEKYNYTFFPQQCDKLPYEIGTLVTNEFKLRADIYRELNKESRKIYPNIKRILPELFRVLYFDRNNKNKLAVLEVGFEYICNLSTLSNDGKTYLLENLLADSYYFNDINKVYNKLLMETIDEAVNKIITGQYVSRGTIGKAYVEKVNKKVYAVQYEPYSDVLTMGDFIQYHQEPLFTRMVKILRNENTVIQNTKKEMEKLRAIALEDGYTENSLKIELADNIRLPDCYILSARLKRIAEIADKLGNNCVTWKELKSYQQVNDCLNQLEADLANARNAEENQRFAEVQKATLKEYENETYKIIIPLNVGECITYGDRLSNCLGHFEWDNYLRLNKRAAFVVLNKTTNKYVACVDISLSNKHLCQCLGPCNSTITDQNLLSFIHDYLNNIIKAR